MPERATTDRRRTKDRRRADRRKANVLRGWLVAISILWIWAAVSLQGQITDFNNNRVTGTQQRCDLGAAIRDTAVDLGVPRESPRLKKLNDNVLACYALLDDIKEQVHYNP